jgi:hypothetical protein
MECEEVVVFIPTTSVTMPRYRIALAAALLAATSLLCPGREVLAQGKGHGNKGEHVPPGQAKKKVVTADQAIVATREVLVSHGYEIVRVETVRETRVVYYRRGNMGRGKGKGPVERIVIRPEPERIVWVSPPPKGLLIDINVRLGM